MKADIIIKWRICEELIDDGGRINPVLKGERDHYLIQEIGIRVRIRDVEFGDILDNVAKKRKEAVWQKVC